MPGQPGRHRPGVTPACELISSLLVYCSFIDAFILYPTKNSKMSARSKWKNAKCVLCASSFPTTDAISVEDELSGSIGATLRGYLLLFNILPPDLVPKTAVSCPPCFDLVQTSAEIHRSFNESLSTIKSVIPPPVATRGNASGELVERLTDFVSLRQRGL
jgi:hypothetical protein